MTQQWKKQGKIYSGRSQVPTVFIKDEKTWRIYFTDRTLDNRSFIRYIDVEAFNPKNIIYECKVPVLPWGNLGTFDHRGTMVSWVMRDESKIKMYYIGWSQRKDVPYHNGIGLAISNDNGDTFTKFSDGPILSNSVSEPYFTGTSCVIKTGRGYENWYLSCTQWLPGDPAEPRYNIKHRFSDDGISWENNRTTSIDYKDENEGGICRASVIPENELYKMWYCYRNQQDYRTNPANSYRIGYAEKNNSGWQRKDSEINLRKDLQDFETEMQCYPHVIKHKDRYFMFYNGNGFGATGIGYATLEG